MSKEQFLLTLCGLFVAYFIGHVVVAVLYNHILPFVSVLWQDGATGFFALASTLPIAGKIGKVKTKETPISIVRNYVTKSGKNRVGMVYGSEDGKLPFDLWYLLCHNDNRAKSLFDFAGYSVELKKPVYLIKPEYANIEDAKLISDIRSLMSTGLTPEIKEKAAALQARKQAEKDAKKASKPSKVGGNVNAVSAKIEALKQMQSEGLITPIQLAELISKI